jgi:hypothetical protein
MWSTSMDQDRRPCCAIFFFFKSLHYTERPFAAAVVALAGFGLAPAAPALPAPIDSEAATLEAEQAARAWLALVDSGQYGESWDEAAGYFRNAVTRERWTEMLRAVRSPLGELESRDLGSTEHATTLPGAPDDDFVVLRFRTSFANKRSTIETVTPMLEETGTWRVSG